MAAEPGDALAQHGDLNLCRSGVGGMGLVAVDELLLFSCIERHAKRPALLVQRTNLPLHGHTYAEGRFNQRRLARNHPSPSLDAGTSSPVATARIALRISKSSYPSVLRVSCKS